MKNLMIIAVAALVAAPALAQLNSAWTRKQTEDPRVLRETLSTNFGEAETRIAGIEAGTADVALAAAKVWVGNASGNQAAQTVSGDVTITTNGAVTIAAAAVTLAKQANIATLSVIGRSTAATGVPEVLTAATDHFVLRRSGAALAFGLLVDANVDASADIAATKIDGTAVVLADITGATGIALTPADAGSTTGTVTVAITDIAGAPADALASWWISDTSGGAASATNVDAVSVTTGTAIIAASSTIVNSAVSTGGALVIEVDMTAAGTNYVSVAVGGLIAEAQLVTE